MPEENELALEHAWNYFQYHAEQRITVFNFFVATSGLLVAGMAFTAQASVSTWPLGLSAGILLMLVSLAFWRLDQRVSSMIKLAEEIIAQVEAQLISDANLRMISREQAMTANTKFGLFHAWTYGRAFRVIFSSMALVGLLGSGLAVSRALLAEDRDKVGTNSPSQSLPPARTAPRPSGSPSQLSKPQTAK